MLLPGMCSRCSCCAEDSCHHLSVSTSTFPDARYPIIAFELAEAPAATTLRVGSHVGSQARKLKRALGVLGVGDWKQQILRSIPLLQFGGMIAAVGGLLSPQVHCARIFLGAATCAVLTCDAFTGAWRL
jgi:hypothetical protein